MRLCILLNLYNEVVMVSGVGSSSVISYATQELESVQGESWKLQEKVNVTILTYDDLQQGSLRTQLLLIQALKEEGIVGIRGIPKFKESVQKFIEAARAFSALTDEEKAQYAPNRDKGEFLGYELGAEVFTRPDGSKVADDSKASYYAFVPDHDMNIWPKFGDLKDQFQSIGGLMMDVGKMVMASVGLNQAVVLADNHVGRLLHYRKGCPADKWCGAHFDHGVFTALLPAVYFNDQGKQIPEPDEAGLFVRASGDTAFRKVTSDDPDVMLFQAAEFGQLATNDKIEATEHEVRKPLDPTIERYTKALFFTAPMGYRMSSRSKLVIDTRWGEKEECSYGDWHTRSLDRYRNKTK